MRKKIVLFGLILLFLLPVLYAPQNLMVSDDGVSIGNESQIVDDFVLSADGDESPESIYSFSETLADDVLFYPDGYFLNSTDQVLTSGDDDWVNSIADDTSYWVTGVGDDELGYVQASFGTEVLDISILLWGPAGGTIEILNIGTTSYDVIYTHDGSAIGWHNFTEQIGYVNTSRGVTVRVDNIQVDLLIFNWYQMTLVDDDHYAESFADVSDWTLFAGLTQTSDGDVMSWPQVGDNAYDSLYVNSPSLAVGSKYIEYRIKSNTSTTYLQFISYTGDSRGGVSTGQKSGFLTTSWVTVKIYTSVVIECVLFFAKDTIAPSNLQVDYLRIGPADESGWQHDGSTTVGVTNDATASNSYSVTSDGDVLNLTVSRDGGAGGNDYGRFYFPFDTTATAIGIENTYYQFVKASFNVTGSVTNYFMRGNWDSKYADVDKPDKDTPLTTFYCNVGVGAGAYDEWIYFQVYLAPGWSVTWYVDFIKVYSIANFTVTQSGATVDDYLYVDSGVLYSNVDDGYIEANHDPVLAVNGATYPLYNLTTSGTAPEYSQYIGSWSSYSDDTRGVLSGVVIDIKLKFNSTEILSEIVFIDDGTAPVISSFWTVPYTPNEEDDVTLAIYETDAGGGTYTVVFNAVDYPAGFVDVDLDATESSNKGGLWSYTIDSGDLPAGYYAFEVTASDGANEVTSLEIFRVTSIYLQITDLMLITATENTIQLSGRSNKDCSYQVYENDTLEGSGSVSDGLFSISWNKDATSGAYIEIGVRFYVGIYEDWINGSYSVASASITEFVCYQNNVSIVIGGFFNYPAGTIDYEIWEHGVSIDTGSFELVVSGDYYSIYWEKNEPLLLRNFTITLTSGSSVITIRGYSLVIDTATYLYYYSASSLTEGDTYIVGDDADRVNAENARFIMSMILTAVFVTVAIGIGYGFSELKKKRKGTKTPSLYTRQGHA